MSPPDRIPVSEVDPNSIVGKVGCAPGAELLIRERPPGRVSLDGGHREHLLMCTRGSSAAGQPVHSVLRTEAGVREWHSCPEWDVTFVPAGFPMEWEWSYESHSMHLAMHGDFLLDLEQQMEAERTIDSLRPVFRVNDTPLRELLRRLQMESGPEQLGSNLVTSSILTIIGVELFRLSGSATIGIDSSRLSETGHHRSVEMIRDRLAESISLSEIAREAGLSPYHFARQFKQTTGYPPHEYQLQLRVQRARELLRAQPRRSIAEIGHILGFTDESHFRRHFKRIVGVTPGKFRD